MILVALSSESSATASERGTSSTVKRLLRPTKSSSARIRVPSTLRGGRASGGAEQIEARFGSHHEAAEERRIETLHVLEGVEHGEPRLGAKEHRRVTAGEIQIDQQRRSWLGTASAVATLTAMVVAPTPPFAPTKAKVSPCTAGARLPTSRLMAACSSGTDNGSVTNSLTPARIASSISAGSSFAATSSTPVVGMIPLQCRDSGRKPVLSAEVQDQHVGLRAARLGEHRERLARDHGAAHAGIANELAELGVGCDKFNHGRQWVLRYRTRIIVRRNDAVGVRVDVPLAIFG